MGFFDDLFGGDDLETPNFPITAGFSTSTPSYNFGTSGTINADLSTDVSSQLTKLASPENTAFAERFPRMLTDVDELRNSLTPGYSQIRKSRLEAVDAAAKQAVGTLRQNAQRRKILGSQFVDDALTRIDLEAGKARGEAEAQSFLEELDANLKILDFEFGQINTALQRSIQELQLSTGVSQTVASILSNNAAIAKNIAIAQAEGSGSLLGTILGTVFGGAAAGIGAGLGETVTQSLFGEAPAIKWNS